VRREARTQGRQGLGGESGTTSAPPELVVEIDAVRAVVTRHAREASAEARALAVEVIRRCRDDVLSALNGGQSATP
jgi:hypothetical protein